jgi:hypothetical protein
MTLEQRKHLLRMACTIDRLQLALLQHPPGGRRSPLAAIVENPFFDIAQHAIVQFFPRRLRVIAAIVRAWRQRLRE